jgi:hypothetical protein
MRFCPAVFVAVYLASAVTGAQELVERTLAIVGGTAITLADARTAITLGLLETKDVNVATEALVQRVLILREVERYAPPEPDATQIDARLAQIQSRIDAAELAAILSAGGFGDARLRAWLRDDLRIASYLDQRFAADGPERRQALIEDWVADLRRRTQVVELWKR